MARARALTFSRIFVVAFCFVLGAAFAACGSDEAGLAPPDETHGYGGAGGAGGAGVGAGGGTTTSTNACNADACPEPSFQGMLKCCTLKGECGVKSGVNGNCIPETGGGGGGMGGNKP